MTHFDRFERDLWRNIWFGCIYALIAFTGVPLVLGFVSSFFFEFPTPLQLREMLAYNIVLSLVIAVVGTLCGYVVDLKRDVEQLKLANSAQVRE